VGSDQAASIGIAFDAGTAKGKGHAPAQKEKLATE